MSETECVKIEMRIEDGDDVQVETPGAFPVGEDSYRLDNSPFFAYNVSWEDIIEAAIIYEHSEDSQGILDELVRLGCSYGGMNHSLIAVNIPPEINMTEVCFYVESTGQDWEHADPSLYPKQ